MSLTVYVRIFVPGNDTPAKSVGHYDLIISGEHEFHGVELTNPVFSYRSTGELHVFEESASSDYYKTASGQYYHDCDIYKWTFTLSNDKYDNFIDALSDIIAQYTPMGDSGKAFSCTLVSSNPFSTYDPQKYNCFHAVAVWLNALGNFTLKAIYDNAHENAYLDYSPANMAKENASYWQSYNPEG